MKKELLKIAKDLDKEKITEKEVRNLLFGLLNVSCCFYFTFNNIEEAKALRTQLNMSNARGYILDQTEDFETMLDEFIDNYS